MEANELRVGNYVLPDNDINQEYTICKQDFIQDTFDRLYPVPLTEECLLKFGFFQLPHFTISNSWYINLGRNRQLSVGNVNDANQIISLQEIGKDAKGNDNVIDLICVWNFDYDGRMNVHQFQNLYFALTGQELQIK